MIKVVPKGQAFDLPSMLVGFLTEDAKGKLARKIAEEAKTKIAEQIKARYPRSDMVRDVEVRVEGTKIKVYFNSAKARAMEVGVKPHAMTYLVGKTVPIRTPGGVIYRRVSPAALAKGKWRHPGTEGQHIVEGALDLVADDANGYAEAVAKGVQDTICSVLSEVLGR